MKDFISLNISENTVEDYWSCFDQNGVVKNRENIRWQFLNDFNYQKYVEIVIDTKLNKTAAIYAVAAVPFKIGKTKVVGSQSLDTITDFEYRGKGWFTKLANSVYRKLIDDNVSLVYGFPNGKSVYGFVNKLEWDILDPVPFLIKPLRSKYFTNKFLFLRFLPNVNLYFTTSIKERDFTLIEEMVFPKEVNYLWHEFSQDILISVDRNKDYLDWRYINKPGENYKIVNCYDSNKNYKGFIVFCIKDKHDGKIGYIMELIYDLKFPKVGTILLKYANTYLQSQNADCILSWCMEHSPNYSVFKKELFFTMPARLRPIELHFGVRSLGAISKGVINNRANWYISYSDSDTV
jgi:hypothetical protein